MATWRSMPEEIITDRLVLNGWRTKDLAVYSVMVQERDPRTAAAHVDRDPLPALLLERRLELAVSGLALFAVRVNGAFAGYCGLTVGSASFDEPEIAYELLQEFHGYGYATEAARAVVSSATTTGRHRLWASVRLWNKASFGVLTKVGFVGSGREVVDAYGPSVWWTRTLE